MDDWKQYKFSDVLDVPLKNGLTKPSRVRGEGVKMVNMGELFQHDRLQNAAMERVPFSDREREGYLLNIGDLLFARQSLVVSGAGKCSIFLGDDEDVTFEGHLIRARANRNIADPLFLYYYFRSPIGRNNIESIVEFTAAAGIRGSDLARLRVDLPPLAEQRLIGRVLDCLDRKIDLNRRMSATLEAMARALFKAWFVDFEPVHANQENRPSTSASPEIAKLFPSEFENRIPTGWVKDTLGNHLEVVRGLSYKGSGLTTRDEGIPMNNLNSVYEGGGYKYEGIKYYNGDFKERHVTKPGDVIVANTEQGHKHLLIGFPAVVPAYFGDKTLFSHHIYRVRPNEGSFLTPQFIYYSLLAPHIRDVVTGCSSGTTVNMLKIDGLQIPIFVLPNKDAVELFSNAITSFWKRQEGLYKENQTLAELRDSLLPLLISGKMRVG